MKLASNTELSSFYSFQLRLDFSNFVLSGPSTLSISQVLTLNGNRAVPVTAIKQSFATQCLTDSFTVTGNGGNSPPVICGTNTGYHSKLFNYKYSVSRLMWFCIMLSYGLCDQTDQSQIRDSKQTIDLDIIIIRLIFQFGSVP